jgi:hypothetical protein
MKLSFSYLCHRPCPDSFSGQAYHECSSYFWTTPYLLKHLSFCRPKEVPQHSEKTLPAVNTSNKADFVKVLEKRMEDLSGGGLARVKKVIKQAADR